MIVKELREAINNTKANSAWQKGVKLYAMDILSYFNDDQDIQDKQQLLNGAKNWHEYSESGNALIYDCDIAERLCSPSELKRKHGGDLQPNNHEIWLDVQARALYQAAGLILKITRQ